ncbi:hypothetical protein POVCU1_002340 [Plasmodium ovale curtisi]|uniref:Uncharacterized protein n=1 Tax=Plasmodium ovale curtisi TaxID=864141 RepID=A0A1A8VJK3_PLAOA|nr:hypothetical protein POVCU1_002340 [Plasmodium ovale curtisi]
MIVVRSSPEVNSGEKMSLEKIGQGEQKKKKKKGKERKGKERKGNRNKGPKRDKKACRGGEKVPGREGKPTLFAFLPSCAE